MPTTIQIRFYEELNDFLPRYKRKITFKHTFKGNMSIKDVIESIGVPHTEVDLILVNRKSVDFTASVISPSIRQMASATISISRTDMGENRFPFSFSIIKFAYLE